MTKQMSRRFVLSGLASGLAGQALANAPLTSPRPRPRGQGQPPPPQVDNLIQAASLGGSVGFLAVNAVTGSVIEAYNADLRLPPASVAKAVTAFYALSNLGAAYRFPTTLCATGPVADGRIEGDLVLRGSGDPIFDTDAMGTMIGTLKDQGIREVTGTFRIDASALPSLPYIDPDQPDHVGYNPAISGLNLNFNRVHFEWKRHGGKYDVTMQARALKYRPAVRISRMDIEDRKAPVYRYSTDGDIDSWSVARRALGQEGSRWLPVRRPAAYTEEVFRTLARSHGIVLKPGPPADGLSGTVLVENTSPQLSVLLRDMLRYSTNLTAETIGLRATQEQDADPASLIASARQMNLWLNNELGTRATGFVDHSGLGYGSRVSARDMVHLLRVARPAALLPKILKSIKSSVPGADIVAKTGTLNFVSALAGYAQAPGSAPVVFAIFTADMPRRDAIAIDERERPPGAREWARRSRRLQGKLIERWLTLARA